MPYTPWPKNLPIGDPKMCTICTAAIGQELLAAHEAFHENYIHKEQVKTMSSAAWCDPGNHAFKAGEPGSQHFGGSTVNADGIPERVEMDACASHSFQPKGAISAPVIQDDITKPFGGTKSGRNIPYSRDGD